jgi:signal transduction histidine kinase
MINAENPPSIKFNQLSDAGKVKLLDMAFSPFVFGFSSVPICALALSIWANQLERDYANLLIWGGVYVVLAAAIRLIRRRYLYQKSLLDNKTLFLEWIPIVSALALTHALGLVVPIFLIRGDFPFEFMLLYYVIVAAIIATYATHLTPLLKAFQLFFIPCWGMFILLSPWAFPQHWHFIALLLIVFALSIHKHSITGHQFFLKQILLEEDIRNAKNQVEEALKAKNQFLTTASHDLRQPIHAMGFLVQSMLHRNRQAELIPLLNDLKHSVTITTQMFNSLMDLSKFELGAIRLEPKKIHLHDLIKETVGMFKEDAYNRQLELRVSEAHAKAIVEVDHLLLRQSLVNLIQNALRYTKSGGVLVGIRKRSDNWQVEVWDTGIGVAIGEQDKIHSPFYRHEHAWRLDSAGHGLGLAVVARCVELMKADYGFSSVEGKGSKFWLRIPVSRPTLAMTNTLNLNLDEVSTEEHSQSLSGRCLIIDDDPLVSRAWDSLLTSWGVEVKCASSAADSFNLLNEGFDPQAIICDQRLRAGESGFELLKALLDRCKSAQGIMVSGEFNSKELDQAEIEGYLVLSKPLQPHVLHAILSQFF